jgi:hypothetical protein
MPAPVAVEVDLVRNSTPRLDAIIAWSALWRVAGR